MAVEKQPWSFDLDSIPTQEKVGQLFMIAVFINDTESEIQQTEELIRRYNIGAVCFFHSRASAATNFEGKKAVVRNENSYEQLLYLIKRYKSAAKIPLLVAMDAEWGLAMRIENTPQYPYGITLGALPEGDNDLIHLMGQHIAKDCLEAGIHWNLAPVVDINVNPNNPVIGYRSFGEDKEQVLAKAQAYISGMKSLGVLNAIKHFPGHGDTDMDSHLDLPVIAKAKEQLEEAELYPFEKLITSENVDAVMVAHLLLPALDDHNPTTTSKKIVSDILRKELDFEGVIISDALNMHAVSKKFDEKGRLDWEAFDAGMDMFCFPEYPKEGILKIAQNASIEAIDGRLRRVWELKQTVFDMPIEEVFPFYNPEELNGKIARKSLTVIDGKHWETLDSSKSGSIISVGKQDNLHFSETLSQQSNLQHFSFEPKTLEEWNFEQTTLLALYPRFAKPKNQFGFTKEEIEFVNRAMARKNCLLYLFGNPYVLNLFPESYQAKIVVVYQDFTAFQSVAIEHFNGEFKAQGKLPFTLKRNRL
ncbi:MAG: glycoside hydrolase family 3 N-terminal domain-containing protein [Bacteroidota bacterium]